MVIIGVTMAKIPKPHRNPMPLSRLVAIGPPIQTVAIYGDETKANIRRRFLSEDVSAMKMDRVKERPLYLHEETVSYL
jgi:hypothetical protein